MDPFLQGCFANKFYLQTAINYLDFIKANAPFHLTLKEVSPFWMSLFYEMQGLQRCVCNQGRIVIYIQRTSFKFFSFSRYLPLPLFFPCFPFCPSPLFLLCSSISSLLSSFFNESRLMRSSYCLSVNPPY
jgi:hypothetical protein